MQFRVDQPEWLWGLLALVPMSWVLLRWCASMSLVRRWASVIVRCGLMLVLLALLAGVSSVRRTDKLALVALLDVSGSVRGFAPPGKDADGRPVPIGEVARRWLNSAIGKRGPEDLLSVVAFDGAAGTIAPPSPPPENPLDRPIDLPATEGTDIAAALRLALAQFPPDAARRVVLISDGVQTQGDAIAAARGAFGVGASGGGGSIGQLSGIPIDVLPIVYDVKHEVSLESLDAPTRAPAGATVSVQVTLRSTGEGSGTLRLFHEDREVALRKEVGKDLLGLPVALHEGVNTLRLPVSLGASRVHRFRALFEPDRAADPQTPVCDTISANNSAEAVTVTPGRGAVLIVDGVSRGDEAGPGGLLARTLRAEGIDVQAVSPDGVPSDMLRLQAYDLVILQNVPADSLGGQGQDRLVRFVTELGGGLIMIGGPDSFAAGGYRGSKLEPILPVKLELPDRLVVPATAVVIVLDCSGSMGFRVMGSSRTQQDIADEGAALAVRSLDRTDLVGVIKFDNQTEVVVPLAKNTDPLATSKKILEIYPNGGTNMPPALDEAHRQLKGVDAKIKHIIALTDGVSQRRERLVPIAQELAADGIKLTTIAVGDGADTEGLAAMASAANGQYYRVTDPHVLPKVFLRAVRVVRTPLVREEPFVPLVLDPASPMIEGLLSAGAMPQLRGLALTQPRTEITAQLPLATSTGEPVLAHWQAGLGQVAAFASDAHDGWAADWLNWPGYRALWVKMVRQVSRPSAQRAADLSVEIAGDQLRVHMEAVDEAGHPLDGLTAPAAVYTPVGDRLDLRLLPVSPGIYEGTARIDQGGSYVVTVSPRQGSKPLAPVVGGVTKSTGVEYRTLRSNRGLLEQLAASTGGKVLEWNAPQAARLFDRSQTQAREARTPLWPYLLPWALALAVLDVGVRRIAWDRLISSRFGEGLARHARSMVRDRSAQASATTEQLRGIARPRPSDKPEFVPVKLSGEDAKRLVAQRRQERKAAAKAVPGPVSTAKPTEPPAPAMEEEGGLAAAKRRARERFDKE